MINVFHNKIFEMQPLVLKVTHGYDSMLGFSIQLLSLQNECCFDFLARIYSMFLNQCYCDYNYLLYL